MTIRPLAPSPDTVERIRLLLSAYQDGSGMLQSTSKSLPGWRDFERSVAVAVNGAAQENKSVFDVIVQRDDAVKYGISCKMRRELSRFRKHNEITLEVSNAAGEFWGALREAGISTETALRRRAGDSGSVLQNVVDGWYNHAANAGFNLARSSFLVLLWDKDGSYQLFQLPLNLYNATHLTWSVPNGQSRLCGHLDNRVVVEWYFASGGQLKVYPRGSQVFWHSEEFKLEPLPDNVAMHAEKAAMYFPELWRAATSR